MSGRETLHRHDEGGPTADIACGDGSATAEWHLPPGQLLEDHPELGTGGYVYFTTHAESTIPIPGDLFDFSGHHYPDGVQVTAVAPVTPGVEYRAHLLVAYEDGPAWHNDTVFACEAATAVAQPAPTVEADVLPYTGIESGLALLALVLAAFGAWLLRRAG